MKTKFELRREYVNREFKKRVSGTSMNNKKKKAMFKALWKEAKSIYK